MTTETKTSLRQTLRGDDLKLYLKFAEEVLAESKKGKSQESQEPQPLAEPTPAIPIYEPVTHEPQPQTETAEYRGALGTKTRQDYEARTKMQKKPKKEGRVGRILKTSGILGLTAAFSLYTSGGNKNNEYATVPTSPPAITEPKPILLNSLDGQIIDNHEHPPIQAPKPKMGIFDEAKRALNNASPKPKTPETNYLKDALRPNSKPTSPASNESAASNESSTAPKSNSLKDVLKPKQSPTISTQNAEAQIAAPTKWQPSENAQFDDNGEVQIWPDKDIKGVTNLYYKDEKNGQWVLYNNIVPEAHVQKPWARPGDMNISNAEMEHASITRSVIQSPDGPIVRLSYPKLSNGAHFHFDIKMTPQNPDFSATLGIEDDSAKIDLITLGNFLGMSDMIRELSAGGKTLDVRILPDPQDGPGKTGKFNRDVNLGPDKTLTAKGDGLIQQQIISATNTLFEYEVRRRAWVKGQSPKRDENWAEALKAFSVNPRSGDTWTFKFSPAN